MACNCYAPCLELEKMMGMVEHKDADLLIGLIQDESRGLPMKRKGDDGEEWWVDVELVQVSILVLICNLFSSNFVFLILKKLFFKI